MVIFLVTAQAGWNVRNVSLAVVFFLVVVGLALFLRRASFKVDDIDLRNLALAGWAVLVVATVCGLAAGWFVLQEPAVRQFKNQGRVLAAVLSGAAITFAIWLASQSLLQRFGVSMMRNDKPIDDPVDRP